MAMLNSFGSGVRISQEWLQVDMLLVRGRRKRIIEGSEQDQMRKEKKKIKNRASAARSRQKKIEKTKFMEEQVDELRKENTQMERLIKLMMEEEEEKAEETANRPSSLKRTFSTPW
ncbi:hypothetical protein JCGZ_13571 [Jatropha curcas]|uniref:BZIP domain-containing protein n=1 Tax=Jatropha curcas TaxID=180498 RepID=A0A067KMU9_JATCU|nr:ABSCISIC ACID-INSENSITIVE 5-like protein 7 [Jatropha curcas]KDP33124.1 hypothetical protein JCGZ_13571 [Jatropha curcas]